MTVMRCAYCDHEYPEEPGASPTDLLNEHIKTCPSHPLREVERELEIAQRRNEKLKKAMSGLLEGESSEQMLLTPEETKVVELLGEAWDAFLKLPRRSPPNTCDDETTDFRQAIHTCQRIVMSQPVKRKMHED